MVSAKPAQGAEPVQCSGAAKIKPPFEMGVDNLDCYLQVYSHVSCLMLSRIASDKRLLLPPSWTYQPLELYWEQKMVDDFLCLLTRNTKMPYCSDPVALARVIYL